MERMKIIGFAVLIVFIISAQSWAAENEKRDTTSDLWLEAKLFTTYSLNEHLNPFDLDVDVKNGAAILGGKVNTVIDKNLALKIARNTEGIKSVKDNISVAPPAGRDDPYGYMASVRNSNHVARVKYNLMWNKETHGMDIDVDTDEGAIVLSGTVASEAERNLVVNTARNTSGVRIVVDNLTVDRAAVEKRKEKMNTKDGDMSEKIDDEASVSEKTGEALDSAGVVFTDAWITTKVKSRLLFDKHTDGLDINVDTDKGIVTLEGTVASQKEKNYTLKIVKGMENVRKVVDKLTIDRFES